MNKTKITEIVEKELLKFFDAKTLLRHNKEIMEFSIKETLKAINYTSCCTELKAVYITDVEDMFSPYWQEYIKTNKQIEKAYNEGFDAGREF